MCVHVHATVDAEIVHCTSQEIYTNDGPITVPLVMLER